MPRTISKEDIRVIEDTVGCLTEIGNGDVPLVEGDVYESVRQHAFGARDRLLEVVERLKEGS